MGDGGSGDKPRVLGMAGRPKSARNGNLPPWMLVRRRENANYYYYSTKDENGKRKEIPLGPDIGKALEEYRKLHPKWSLRRRYMGMRSYAKLLHCESCGFVAVDACQLDVDHKDGNHKNSDHRNLWTLCANCHRLKTKVSRDGIYHEAHKQARKKKRTPDPAGALV